MMRLCRAPKALLTVELLERRDVPAATVFIDFGFNFQAFDAPPVAGSGLAGPGHYFDLARFGEAGGAAEGVLLINSLEDALSANDIDFNGDGTIDLADAQALGDQVAALVRRTYEPFDVQVQIVSARTMNDVLATLSGTATNDAYIFVGGRNTSTNTKLAGAIGFAPVNLGNTQDNGGLAFALDLFETVDGDPGALATALARTTAHEAGHTFGLRHVESEDADQRQLMNGDLMNSDGNERFRNPNLAYRNSFTVEESPDSQRTFQTLFANLGLRPNGPAYVVGTGAHDLITIAPGANANEARVTVLSFRDAARTQQIDRQEYTVGTVNGVLVEASLGDDRVEVTTNVNVVFRGGAGNDTFVGAAGRDTIEGEAGNDDLRGGTGGDTYVFGRGNLGTDTIAEAANSYSDTLDFSAFGRPVAVDLGAGGAEQTVSAGNLALTLETATSIENVVGSSRSDRITGNSRSNVLEGRGGSDTYVFGIGKLGSDTIEEAANADGDTLDFSAFGRAVAVNLGTGGLIQAVSAGALSLTLDSATGVENVGGGDQADTLTGNSRPNRLEGGPGNDTLAGAAGDDTYVFGTGTFLGSDTITEGANANVDTLDFSGFGRAVKVDLSVANTSQTINTTFLRSTLTLTLSSGTGIENVVGGSKDDNVTGNTRANRLEGRGGNDTMAGGNGNDTFVFGSGTLGSDTITEAVFIDVEGGSDQGTDALDFSDFGRAVKVNLGLGTAQTVSPGNLTLTLKTVDIGPFKLPVNEPIGFENVIGSNQADTITGNSDNNQLVGRDGADTLVGGIGNDSLLGENQNDQLEGGGGNDRLEGGTGSDTYVFAGRLLGSDTVVESANADNDTLDFSKFGVGVTINLGATSQQQVNGNDLFLTLSNGSGIENVTGSESGDFITGNGRNNVLTGGGGNDTLFGMGGSDTLFGDGGTDQLHGGDENDHLNGTHSLSGGGDDYDGGPGDDRWFSDGEEVFDFFD